jgi:hypothetical protein
MCWNVTSAIYSVFQDADTDSAKKNAKKDVMVVVSATYRIIERCMRGNKRRHYRFWTVDWAQYYSLPAAFSQAFILYLLLLQKAC